MKKNLFFIISMILLFCACSANAPAPSPTPTAKVIPTEKLFPSAAITAAATDTQTPLPTKQRTPRPTAVKPDPISEALLSRLEAMSLQSKMEGHASRVWKLAAGENGLLASGGIDGHLMIWDAKQMLLLHDFDLKQQSIEEIHWLNTDQLLTLGENRSVKLTSLAAGTSEKLELGQVRRLALSEDRLKIAVETISEEIFVYSWPELNLLNRFPLLDNSFEIHLSPDAEQLFTGSHNGEVFMWDLQSGAIIREFKGLRYDVHCLDLTPDGRYLAAGATDQNVIIWEVSSGQKLSSYRHYDGLYDLEISADGSFIVSGGPDKYLFVADLRTGTVIARHRQADEIHTVSIDPALQYIAAGGYDNLVYLWAAQE